MHSPLPAPFVMNYLAFSCRSAPQELNEACGRTGMDAEKVTALMREIDTDGDGTINYSEFLVATTDVRPCGLCQCCDGECW